MHKQMMEMIEQSAETALESARRWGACNLRVFDRLFQQQADLAAFYLDAGARGLALASAAKGYQELMAGQAALLRECGERNVDALRQGVSLGKASGDEYGTLAREGYQQVREQLEAFAGLATKAAA